MTISDASSVIEMSATLSIAFVAVEYVKSYTAILCDRFFKFNEFITEAFKECRDMLADKETLKCIKPITIEGKRTNNAIEKVRRNNESLTKEIGTLEKQKTEDIKIACQAQSMSSLCLFQFLFSMILLFLSAMENDFPFFVHLSSIVLCLLSIIYTIGGWVLGERKEPIRLCDFSSLRHSVWSFIFILILSILLSTLFSFIKCNFISTYLQPIWWFFLICGTLCCYLNFIVFIFKINKKAEAFKKEVTTDKDSLKQRCKVARQQEQDLISTQRFCDGLKTD